MPAIKLSYFDFAAGRGEDCRLALHIAGVPFEDDRFPGAEWPERKAKTPFGAVPVLTVDGREIGQSTAILTWIGRQYDLHPGDAFQAAQHEALMLAAEELRDRVWASAELDAEAKKSAREAFAEGWMAHWARTVEGQIEGPFIGGQRLNVADIKLAGVVGWILSGRVDYIAAAYFDAYPKLKGLREAVQAHPRVQQWYGR